MTPSDNSFTISPHNLALLHSTLLHSYPVPLTKVVPDNLKACPRFVRHSNVQLMWAKWIPSIAIPLLGTGYWNDSLPSPEGRNIHKFDFIGEPVYCHMVLRIKRDWYNNFSAIRPKKKKLLCRPHPTKIWKLGRSVDFFFFFFFFWRTVRELSFPIFFFKFLNGENSGGMQSKRIYKCFFKPLNTNFSKFFAQIWHKKKKKKKNQTLFFRILRSVGRGQHNNNKKLA